MARFTRRSILTFGIPVLIGACEPAGEVRVQELPPLARPSPERRAGLPEVAGTWRFVGFSPPAMADSLAPQPAVPGTFAITTQRLDSLAGFYDAGAGRVPLVGEVRRDGVVSLVAFATEGGRFAAGRVLRDTLWIELSSFGVAESWPEGTRAAFSRNPPPPPPAPAPQTVPPTAADTARADTAGSAAPPRPAATVPVPAGPPVGRPAPVRPAPRPPAVEPVAPPPTVPDTPIPATPDTTPVP